jgi:hypothetical protein
MAELKPEILIDEIPLPKSAILVTQRRVAQLKQPFCEQVVDLPEPSPVPVRGARCVDLVYEGRRLRLFSSDLAQLVLDLGA